MSDAVRTSVKEALVLGHYSANWVCFDDEEGIDSVSYSGPGLKYTSIRTWNAFDRSVILQALNEAYRHGRDDALETVRVALGIARDRHG